MGSIHHDDNNDDDEESLCKTHPQQQQHSQQEKEEEDHSSTQLLITTITSPSSSSSPCPASTSSSEDDDDEEDEDEEEELGRRIPMLPRRRRFEPLHSQFQTAERRRPRQWNHSPFQQQQPGRAPLFLPLFGSVPSLSPHGGGTTTKEAAAQPSSQQFRRALLLLQLVGCLTMALVLGRGLRVLWSSSEKPPSWNLAPLELVVPESNERLGGRPLWDYLQPTLRQTVGTTNTEYIIYLRSNQHHTAWTWTETVQSYLTCPHLVELWIDDPTNANDASSVVLPNRVWNHPAVRFTPTTTTNDWKNHPPQQEEEERPSALFVVDPSRRYSCHELDRAIQEWKRDPTRLVGLEPPVWYQQAPQDDDESSSSLSWSYSLVSDKALLLHSRIYQLLKLAEQQPQPDEAAATRRAQTRAAVECREYRWSAQWAAVSQQAPTALMTMSTVRHHQQHDDDKSWCHTKLLEATHQTSFPSNQVLYTGRQVQSY